MTVQTLPQRQQEQPSGEQLPRYRRWLTYVALAIATTAVYWQVREFSFVNFDDDVYILNNPALRMDFFPDGLRWAFTSFRGGNWHPLTWLSHILGYKLFGLDPGGPHLVNVALHVANSLLLLHVLATATGRFWRSALVATLFALHPLHVESVAWISERKDLLGAFFWMLAMRLYLRYTQARSAGRYGVVVLVTVLGLLSKATLVTLPLVLLLLDFWPLGRWRVGHAGGESRLNLLKEKVPLLAVAALKALFTIIAPVATGAMITVGQIPLVDRIGNAFIAAASYLAKTVWPAGLAVLYPYPATIHWERAALSGLVLVALSILAFRSARSRPALAMGWAWYLLVLSPMSGIVQVGPQSMADRYTYLPHIGLFMAAVWAIPPLSRSRPVLRAILACALVAALPLLVLMSWRQVGTWRSSVTLFQRAVDVTKRNGWARNNLAQALIAEGRFEEALVHLGRALEINPKRARVHTNQAVALEQLGRAEEALAHYREAARLAPESAAFSRNLGFALARMGRSGEAAGQLRNALSLDPADKDTWLALAASLVGQGKTVKGNGVYRALLKHHPDSWEAHFELGLSLGEAGRLEEAVAHFSRAVEIVPENAVLQYNLALAHDRSGQADLALRHYRLALELDPGNFEALNNIGAISAEQGRLEEALEHFRCATQLDPGYVEAHFNLGRALLGSGDRAGAAASFSTVLLLQPDHLPARELLDGIAPELSPPPTTR